MHRKEAESPVRLLVSDMGKGVVVLSDIGDSAGRSNRVTDNRASRLSPVYVSVCKALYYVYFCISVSHHELHIKTTSYLYSHPKCLVC